MEEKEEEALRQHCRRMIVLVRSKQQQLESSEEERRGHQHKGARGRESTGAGGQVASDELRDRRECKLALPDRTKRVRDQTSLNIKCQGLEEQPVPPQLILMLRLKTFMENMRRAAEVELHDPAVCRMCEQEQASLALKSFIRRKKTQLQFQTLKGRLNTHFNYGEFARRGAFGAPHWNWEELLVDICGSQQPGVTLATTKERGVALATDEMRGYPDNNATGTNLASPRCTFADR